MATVTLLEVACLDDHDEGHELVLKGTSSGVGSEQIWVQVGNEWFKAKVNEATGDWQVRLDDEFHIADGDGVDITAGVYLNPAHRPHVGAHKELVDPNAFDTGRITNLPGGANLVANGSFEADVGLTDNTFGIVPVPGWTGTNGSIEVWRDLVSFGPAASDGHQNIELDSDLRVDAVSQAITTVVGAHYRLSFDYASRTSTAGAGNTTDAFTVFWNGVQVAAIDPTSTTWTARTIDFTGTGSDVLEFREAGANDAEGALIDRVSVVSLEDCGDFILTPGGGQSTSGQDSLMGTDAHDFLRGGVGDDLLFGGAAWDDLHGNVGNDTLHGGTGGDWVVGGQGNDLLFGDEGRDLIYGQLGNDTLNGGDGDDGMTGGQGADVIRGQAGDDFISGALGSDTVSGGSGADLFHTSGNTGLDLVLDFNWAEGDHVVIEPETAYTLRQEGADTVIDMGGGNLMVLAGVQLSTLPAGGEWIIG